MPPTRAEDPLDLTSTDARRVSLILAELADCPSGLTVHDLGWSCFPPEDRPSSIDQIVYRLLRDLDRRGIVVRLRPRGGEYRWRYALNWTGGPSVPKEWAGYRGAVVPVPRRLPTVHCRHGYDVEQSRRKFAR